MTDVKSMSVYRGRSLFVWGLFCALSGLIFLFYAFASLTAGHGEFVMPLDDVYIHFQYAKQMALGQPYIYNPGLPPTSGATSFLYPYVLAIGYLFGFQGLNLGLWAMLLGMVALACSTWLVYRLLLALDSPEWLAILSAAIFVLSGPVAWHFMSGMETGFVVLFTLWTLYALIQADVGGVIVAATLLALIRPEMGILTVLAVVALFVQTRKRYAGTRYTSSLLIPVLAIGLQPLVNLLLTGSAVASGNAAKSVFGIVPFYWDEVIRRILDNFVRLWTEFLTGSSPREGLYIAPFMLLLAVIGLIALLRNREQRIIGLMLIGWLLFGTLAISTLDTAFWHFKRYQMPFLALLFPLAGWGIAALWGAVRSPDTPANHPKTPIWIRGYTFLTTTFRDPIMELFVPRLRDASAQLQPRVLLRPLIVIVMGFGFAVSLSTAVAFLHHYGLNGLYVYQQPLQMARWLETNTPPDAVIAVHDVGMMRYVGGRTTLDMVGLTTPGAAEYWRNGPGSIAEFLIQQRPDYIASYGYGHGFGLGMLADTSLYGEPIASFPVDLDDHYNVALAANFQGIYELGWEIVSPNKTYSLQPFSLNYWGNGSLGTGSVDVASLESEKRSNYYWTNQTRLSGFPTEVRSMDYVSCAIDNCFITDGGRLINGEESFDIWTYYDSGSAWDVALITRIHPAASGTIDIYANDEYIDTRWIPAIPGQWLELVTCVPEEIAGKNSLNRMRVRIVSQIPGGFYEPYYHWLYDCPSEEKKPGYSLTTFQSGAIVLASAQIDHQPGDPQLALNIDWYTDGSAQGDYKVFVHILDENDQIVAQTDTYPGNGTLPPGNWLPGILHDTIMVDLNNVSPGTYRVAIGLYDPYTFERLQPAGGDDQNRFFIGDVEIE